MRRSLKSYSIAYLARSIFSLSELLPVPIKNCFLNLLVAILAISSFFSKVDIS